MRPLLALLLIPALAGATLTFAAPTVAAETTTGGIAVHRLSGADRYATAVAISAEYAPGVEVVYVAAGSNYPDALSAAPAAAALGGPLLLTPTSGLPGNVRDAVARLAPARIVVVGGPAAVSEAVYRDLAALAPTRRDAGADRYETSRIINLNAFPAGARTAFVATGTDFPDALSASAAAGSSKSPVILVQGGAPAVNALTRGHLSALGVSAVTIAGGTSVVSPGIEASLRTLLGTASVARLSGADRYSTSSAINRGSFTSAPSAYFAGGTGFADALAGAALAAHDNAPLYVVPGACVPPDVLADLKSLGTTRHLLLGGYSSLGAGVENLTACATAPANLVAPTVSYPLHTNVVATTFWVGEIFNADLSDGSQVCSTYNGQWAFHHTGKNIGAATDAGCGGSPVGGCDGVSSGTTLATFTCETEKRDASNGYFPRSQPRPLENPFYLDLPFDDVNDSVGFSQRCTVIPWAASVGLGRCADSSFSYMKNRWVQITGPSGRVCYGQIEDAGPSSGTLYHDANYVFGSADARPANKKFSSDPSQGAGMDVSPALNGCLGFASLDGSGDHVNWRFVDRVNVPAGPWLSVVTTSQVTW